MEVYSCVLRVRKEGCRVGRWQAHFSLTSPFRCYADTWISVQTPCLAVYRRPLVHLRVFRIWTSIRIQVLAAPSPARSAACRRSCTRKIILLFASEDFGCDLYCYWCDTLLVCSQANLYLCSFMGSLPATISLLQSLQYENSSSSAGLLIHAHSTCAETGNAGPLIGAHNELDVSFATP